MAKNSELTKALLAEKARHLRTIELHKTATRLSSNRDFNKLIVDYFFTQFAADMAYNAGDLSLPRDDRSTIAEISRAPGHLKRWLEMLKIESNQAHAAIEQIDEDLAEEAETTIEADVSNEDGED